MAFNLDILIHLANVLYLLAFMVREILWLRMLAVLAAVCLIPYFYFRPEPLMVPIYWNVLFTTLNIFWIARLLLERRPVTLTAEEQHLCELVFRFMTPREMIKMLKFATWRNVTAGECLVRRGQPLEQLMIIYSGRAGVEVDGEYVTELQSGQFIGSISYVTDKVAPANVVSLEPTRYVSWSKKELKKFMSQNPEVHSTLKSMLAVDLTKWLQATWARKV